MMPCRADERSDPPPALMPPVPSRLNQGSNCGLRRLRVGRRLLDARPGRAQVGVPGDGLVDQRGELRIVEGREPVVVDLPALVSAVASSLRPRRREPRCPAARPCGLLRCRRRLDRAAGEARDAGGGDDEVRCEPMVVISAA